MRSVVASHGPGSNPSGPKISKFQNRQKTGPISNISPITSRAARDRPEQNPRRIQLSRHRAGQRPRTDAIRAAHDAGCANRWRIVRPPSRQSHGQRTTGDATLHGHRAASAQTTGLRVANGRRIVRPSRSQRPISKRDSSASRIRAKSVDQPWHNTAQHLRKRAAKSAGHCASSARPLAHKRARRGAAMRGGAVAPFFQKFYLIQSEFEMLDTIWHNCIDQIRTLALIPLLGNRGRSGSCLPARSMIGRETPSSACTRRPDEISADGFSSRSWSEQFPAKQGGGGGVRDTAAAAVFGRVGRRRLAH
ncbi:hypothetical protein F511_32929 [Dorcoceras hygrometricum]|uniref:Uncharacterized protein n=1 Tax=Dorcoceras hygrometricum TaxID=472368 RepID=A0A2Z7ADR9_9LAMI|nr:hypothetical protein F511_32929 [Dorcoceras hygrometricum]